jgi:uncharacterized protein YlxW (UPF0749 family)
MKKTLTDIQVEYDDPITIYCDNTSAISISKNPVMHSKTNHIPITLKIQLEEVKRTEEVMRSQIMKKEEDVEKLEEEVVTLRSKIVKVNKNVEETKTSTSVIENEENHSRLL